MRLRTIGIDLLAPFSIGWLVFFISVPRSFLCIRRIKPLAVSFFLSLENDELAYGVFFDVKV